MEQAVRDLPLPPDFLLIDGLHSLSLPSQAAAMPRVTEACLSIAPLHRGQSDPRPPDGLRTTRNTRSTILPSTKDTRPGTPSSPPGIRVLPHSSPILPGPSINFLSYDPRATLPRQEGEELAIGQLRRCATRSWSGTSSVPWEKSISSPGTGIPWFCGGEDPGDRDFGGPAAAVHERKQRQLSKVALVYLGQKKLFNIPPGSTWWPWNAFLPLRVSK